MSKFAFFSALTLENWNWHTPDVTGIGGSETSALEQAKRLAKRGHEVVSFIPFGGGSTSAEGVKWIDSSKVAEVAPTLEDYTWFVYRAPNFFDLVLPKGKYYFVAQDCGYDWTPSQLEKLTGYICLCEEHCKQTLSAYPALKGRVFRSSNGVRRDLIEAIEKEGIVRNPKKLIYASSPDRGLTLILKDWFRVREAVPDAELHVFYGRNNMHKMMQLGADHLTALDKELDVLLDQPGVISRGRINQPDLIREMFSSSIWFYPSDWAETSCQPAGSKVLTKKGVKDIEDIEIGDLVWTHKGRFRKVTETFSRHFEGNLVSLNPMGAARPIYFTPDHLIYTGKLFRRNDMSGKRGSATRRIHDTFWLEAEQVRPVEHGATMAKCTGGNLTSISFLDYIDNSKFCEYEGVIRHRDYRPTYKTLPLTQEVNEDFAFVLGLFAGDGCAHMTHGSSLSAITFAHHSSEESNAKRIRDFFGAGCETKRISDNEIRTIYHHSIWSYFLRYNIGVSREKRVPEFIYDAPKNIQKAFVDGYYAADGAKRTDTKRRIDTISPSLAYGVQLLLSGMGVAAGIQFTAKKNCYTINWTEQPKSRFYSSSDDHFAKPFEEVGSLPFSGLVYNFEVEEDHSYLTEGMTVHNCIQCMEMQACGVYPITNNYWAVGENVFSGVMLDGIPQKEPLVRASLVREVINALEEGIKDDYRVAQMCDARDTFDWEKYVTQFERFAQ